MQGPRMFQKHTGAQTFPLVGQEWQLGCFGATAYHPFLGDIGGSRASPVPTCSSALWDPSRGRVSAFYRHTWAACTRLVLQAPVRSRVRAQEWGHPRPWWPPIAAWGPRKVHTHAHTQSCSVRG